MNLSASMAMKDELKGVDCGAAAAEGVRAVLRARLEVMCGLRADALRWEDIEGVHKMRVASRRLRSALRDFEGLMEGGAILERRVKVVAGALGDVRDQDVAVAALSKLKKRAKGDVAEGIAQLVGERDEVRARARARLETVIAGATLADLRAKFLLRVERIGTVGRQTTGVKRVRGARTGVSFRRAGRKVIEARMRELRGHGKSLHHPFEAEALHETRIAAKRLRYALELFAPCWGGRLTSCSREVAGLQTSLGELHDCDLWIADLGARLDRRHAGSNDPDADARISAAGIWLLDHFTRERGRHFSRALARWHEWETGGFFERMSALLGERQTGDKPGRKAQR